MENKKTGWEIMKLFVERLSKLVDVKSLVTLSLTGVFAVLSLRGGVPQDFMTIFTVIIAFYFGTQAAKGNAGK